MDDDPELELAQTFGEIARVLVAEDDPPATLDRIVHLAVGTIDNCQHAGITVIDGLRITSPASSDEIPALVDRLQSETGEGPCVDAIRDHAVFYTGHLSSEERWPHFAPRAREESGVESILSFRLFTEGGTLGALNLYSDQPEAFGEHDTAVGAVFAAHAAVAWSTAQTIEHLRQGMESRQLIGEATGILMARQHISSAEAFDILRRSSQRLNVKLRLIAERVARSEDIPEAG
jgi:GAF domain-containing protein